MPFSDSQQINAVRKILGEISARVDLPLSIRLWDGSSVSLCQEEKPPYYVSISEAGVLGSILRKPTAETVARHYASGRIDIGGGDLIEIGEAVRPRGSSRKALKGVRKGKLIQHALPLLFAKLKKEADLKHGYASDEVGRKEEQRNNKDYIQFHYDVGNEFYRLFLDPEMQYSCGYFKDFGNSLEQAQLDKLEMICRKLRLQEGETMLDIGCGWGGLICHAAKHYGVKAHGITLSQEQHDLCVTKIEKLGLKDRVTVALCDYRDHQGSYDKIASVGMYEHIGIANIPHYFRKIRSMLRDRGVMLNHAIARRAKSSRKKARKIRSERKLLLKYIFPGSELVDVGHTLQAIELAGFEVHDVEGWREHYAYTSRHWCKRLSKNKERAIELVGEERYRLWVAYLAGVSFGFADGGMRIFQVVATKHSSKGPSQMPPTRADLYR